MAQIRLENVSKVYPRASRAALDKVNLNIERGDFVFLVGASGAGKTTLLSLLLREEKASDGEIHVAGNDLRRLPDRQIPFYRRNIGFIFQDYKLLENKTVWQNVAFALEVIGTKTSVIKSVVPQVLAAVGLTGKEKRYPHELSGGEAQRVAIARAYANHPQIILADEPTGNLDPTTSVGIMEVLDAINRTGTTIVMATHNEEIVNSMQKRVIELHGGHIVRDEAQGSYDSALYFDEQNESAEKSDRQSGARFGAQSEANAAVAKAQSAAKEKAAASVRAAAANPAAASAANSAASNANFVPLRRFDDTGENEGLAALAKSVHSGRTGRYGKAFPDVETTLTWGKGIKPVRPVEPNSAEQKSDGCSAACSSQAPAANSAAAFSADGKTSQPAQQFAASQPQTAQTKTAQPQTRQTAAQEFPLPVTEPVADLVPEAGFAQTAAVAAAAANPVVSAQTEQTLQSDQSVEENDDTGEIPVVSKEVK